MISKLGDTIDAVVVSTPPALKSFALRFVEIVHLLTDAKAERTVVMTWRDTWRNECYELG